MLKKLKESMQGYSIKGLKSYSSRNGVSTEASVYIDKQLVAEVMDKGDGSIVVFKYSNQEVKEKFIEVSNEYVRATYGEEFTNSNENDSSFFAFLCDTHESIKKIIKLCKTQCLVQLKEDVASNSFRKLKIAYSQSVANRLKIQYKDSLHCIINEEMD